MIMLIANEKSFAEKNGGFAVCTSHTAMYIMHSSKLGESKQLPNSLPYTIFILTYVPMYQLVIFSIVCNCVY
jgi:hypothetical protein